MKYKLIIRPEAEVDLSEAFSWYEEKRKGLGHDFLLQIEAGLFEVLKVIVLAVVYGGRNPKWIKKRIRGRL